MQKYSTLKAKLIYIFTIGDADHQGCVKIGEATLEDGFDLGLQPNSSELNAAARKRIDQYTRTAGINYTLRHTELAFSVHDGLFGSFNDKDVHNVLLRSGIQRHDFSRRNQGTEWFECSVDTAVSAIRAVKEGRFSIKAEEMVPIDESIDFRPEQQMAIDKTVQQFTSGGKAMLWNAKMRFGKTLTALQVIKELKYHRTIIITHRPVVDQGWFEDFHKIFTVLDGYDYGSREKGEPFDLLEKFAKMDPDKHYIYFASMQDLRGAQLAGGKFDKNAAIFKANYDLLIIDEAHEGTQTELGQNVINLLVKEKTHVLNLSGTPFNLLDGYTEDEIFTWDYVMEQEAKLNWDLSHFGDPNPYAGLPRMNIFTFDLGKILDGFEDIEDKAFNFTEFFRVWTGDPKIDNAEMPEGMKDRFVYEDHVRAFLDLIVKYDENSNYPFSTLEFRKAFRHTLWMVPGVKAARALSALLKNHPIFSQFKGDNGDSGIVNVAGDGDEDIPNDDALNLVRKAMGDNPEDTMTITLSCGKLTTGVTVPPWTAVMYLSGSAKTDAKAYMQTIFRVQSPYTTKDGRRKEDCYVFDFAPDRTLKVLAEAAKVSNRAKSTASEKDRIHLGKFLNFCPVIGYNGTQMKEFNVERMLEELKKVYISRVTKNGCDDVQLYNMEMLRTLDKDALAKFDGLHRIIGSTKANPAAKNVDLAKNGLTDEEYQKLQEIEKKKRKKGKQKVELTEEDKRLLEEAKEKKKNADNAVSILRGISIRLPLLMYGAELRNEGEDVTLEMLTDPEVIDEKSWEEFMPSGVTKELFKEFIPYYDPDMFRAVSRNYREMVRQADQLAPLERVKAIAAIFECFRNPDKETVLTPWRVVNMHIGDCIGGWNFYEDDTKTKRVKPVFNDHGEVTAKVFKDPDSRILEINSKTGLYPLYMAYSFFAEKLQAYRNAHMLATDVPVEIQNQIWDNVLANNIFIICKTEMAKSITKRTLRGFRETKVNARYFEDLFNKITNQPELFLTKVRNVNNYWNNIAFGKNMKFNAIVGNPPYQANDGSGASTDAAAPIYQEFVNIAKKVCPDYISMIMPSKWMVGGRQELGKFREQMQKDTKLRLLIDYEDASVCFTGVHIDGGICYFLWDEKNNDGLDYRFTSSDGVVMHGDTLKNDFSSFVVRDIRALPILKKVCVGEKFSSIVSKTKPFGIRKDVFNNPEKYSIHNLSENTFKGAVKIYGVKGIKGGAKRQEGFIAMNAASDKYSAMVKYKLFFTTTYSTNAVIPPEPIKAEPYEICTETFLVIGPFNTKAQRDNCFDYIHTKFFRFLLFYGHGTMQVNQSVFDFIPLQDWSRSWTDAELYKKYSLEKNEIAYIESMFNSASSET